MNFLSSFNHPRVVTNLYNLLTYLKYVCSTEDRKSYGLEYHEGE